MEAMGIKPVRFPQKQAKVWKIFSVSLPFAINSPAIINNTMVKPTLLSTASPSLPQIFKSSVSLETMAPLAYIRRRMTSNSRFPRRMDFSPRIRQKED